ncbi:MAG: hypothetical protein ACJAYC_003128 [Halieaceae bacterium]|jgi:hypothetical protein
MNALERPLWIAAGLLLFLSFGFTEMMGSDMWWHLAAGRELFQTGTPWMVDDWSYTAHGNDWLNHEWLADIVYYSWVTLLGVESLVYWKWLIILATFGTLQYALARETGSQFAGFLCAAIAIAIAAPFIDVRPHLYTLLNYAILLALLLGRRASPWLLALLFVIWVNLHGGFFFGLMALGILLFPWREFSVANIRRAFLVGLACVAASVLNPSGIEVFLYPLKYAFDTSSPFRQLGEWLSPFLPGGIRAPLFHYFMWATLLGLLYALPAVRRRAEVPWEGLVLTGLTLAMAITSRRFIPIFGISLAVMLAPLVAIGWSSLNLNRYRAGLASVSLLIALFRLLPYPLSAGPAFHYLVAEYSYPIDMMDFVEANQIKGKVYGLYNWGGYIHWRTDGRLKVFIDGRADTLYSAETYNEYVEVLRGAPGWMADIERSGAEYIIWPNGRNNGPQMLKDLLSSGRWQPVYRDAAGFMLARADMTLAEDYASADAGPYQTLSYAYGMAVSGDAGKAVQYFEMVREDIPYQQQVCTSLASLYRGADQPAAAELVLDECWAIFPSAYLR